MSFKKILSYILTLSICTTGISLFTDCNTISNIVSAESSAEFEGLEYEVLDDNTVEISRYKGMNPKLIIPETIDGKTVKSIGDSAFFCIKKLSSVKLPDSITNIGNKAFLGCIGLSDINIPDGVTNIGESAFSGCTNLKSIKLPNGITNTGTHSFAGCSSLTTVTIPDNIANIDFFSFSDCDNLINITIPNSVKSIGDNAFSNCKSLENIIIPDSVINIGIAAFSSCINLNEIFIPDSVTDIGVLAFLNCEMITIYGYENSYAQTYANENNIPFEVVNSKPNMTDNETIKGDFDNNGSVSTSDFIGLKKYLLFPEIHTSLINGLTSDINDDGTIDVEDLVELKQILLGNIYDSIISDSPDASKPIETKAADSTPVPAHEPTQEPPVQNAKQISVLYWKE